MASGLTIVEGIAVIDHSDVNIRGEAYSVLIFVDGATTFVTALSPSTNASHEMVQCLTEWMDTFDCAPQPLCADMSFQSTELQDFSEDLILTCSQTGPCTLWPNRAEAAVRVFKATLFLIFALKSDPPLNLGKLLSENS